MAAKDIDAAAKRLAEWFGYAWDGLYEGRLSAEYKPWAFNGIGHKTFQGRKDDVRDIVRELIALADGQTTNRSET